MGIDASDRMSRLREIQQFMERKKDPVVKSQLGKVVHGILKCLALPYKVFRCRIPNTEQNAFSSVERDA